MPKTRTSFNVDNSDWKYFKKYCDLQGTNASAKLREFIKMYNKYFKEHKNEINPDLLNNLSKNEEILKNM